jgi:predicted TIM-barrel fold metal-dependent hydrolase
MEISRRSLLAAPLALFQVRALAPEYTVVDAHGHLGDFRIYAQNLSATGPELAAECERRGVSRVFASHATALYYDPERGNEEVLRAARAFPGRVLPAVSFPSPYHPRILQMLEGYAGRGVRVLGELKFEKLNQPAALALLEKAAELNMLVLAHADTADAVLAARAVPRATIVVAHMGTGISTSPYAWRESIDIARGRTNVLFETCTSVVERGMIEEFVRALGAERVVFGTDFPLLDIRVMMAKILDARIAEDDRKLILGGNIMRLLGLRA